MVKMRVANYNFLDSYFRNKLSEQRGSKFGLLGGAPRRPRPFFNFHVN